MLANHRYMSLSITHLGTGSKGNATLLATDTSKVLIDQGFSGKELERRLGQLEIKPDEIDGIVITHHHGDHGGGAAIANKRWGIPLFSNFRTAASLGLDLVGGVTLFEDLERLEIGTDITLLPIPVPHDGADNVGFIASRGSGERAAVFTDLGSWTDEIIQHLHGCAHISIEANYDHRRLWEGALCKFPQRAHFQPWWTSVKSADRGIVEQGGQPAHEEHCPDPPVGAE